MKTHYLLVVFVALYIGSFNSASAQVFNDPRNISQALEGQREGILADRNVYFGFNLGISAVVGKNNLSEFRFNASAGVARGFGWKSDYANFLGYYQLQLECFRGGVGSSLLGTERAKFLFEMRNVFQVTGGCVAGNPVTGRPLTKMVGHSESAIRDPFDYSLTMGTAFVNGINHNRNQQLGFFGIGAVNFAAGYVNDGPFFSAFGFGDSYDRWWSGAGFAGAYFQNDYGLLTEMSLQYQRYTGWQPNLYEMSNYLGIDYLSYKSKKEQFFNQGVWTYNIGFRNSIRVYANIYEVKKLDIQNLLHIGNSYTFHPNTLKKRFTMGAGLLLNGTSPLIL